MFGWGGIKERRAERWDRHADDLAPLHQTGASVEIMSGRRSRSFTCSSLLELNKQRGLCEALPERGPPERGSRAAGRLGDGGCQSSRTPGCHLRQPEAACVGVWLQIGGLFLALGKKNWVTCAKSSREGF